MVDQLATEPARDTEDSERGSREDDREGGWSATGGRFRLAPQQQAGSQQRHHGGVEITVNCPNPAGRVIYWDGLIVPKSDERRAAAADERAGMRSAGGKTPFPLAGGQSDEVKSCPGDERADGQIGQDRMQRMPFDERVFDVEIQNLHGVAPPSLLRDCN